MKSAKSGDPVWYRLVQGVGVFGRDKLTGEVRVARMAMATRFEILLWGGRPESLRAAAEEALDEVERVESWLSPYRPGSELVRMHREGVDRPVRVDPRLFRFLERARELSQQTGGAFDPTVGPLLRAWGFRGGDPVAADAGAVEAARELVGWRNIELNPVEGTVRLLRLGTEIHPGAMGKGYALDRAVEILREAGVENALAHGGTSTVCGLGGPPGEEELGWELALPHPPAGQGAAWPGNGAPRIRLLNSSLSVSATWGRDPSITGAEAVGTSVAHVLDPRTGRPVQGQALAAVEMTGAADSDVWSTALLVAGDGGDRGVRPPGGRWWLLGGGGGGGTGAS